MQTKVGEGEILIQSTMDSALALTSQLAKTSFILMSEDSDFVPLALAAVTNEFSNNLQLLLSSKSYFNNCYEVATPRRLERAYLGNQAAIRDLSSFQGVL
eukprot:IDg5858t1